MATERSDPERGDLLISKRSPTSYALGRVMEPAQLRHTNYASAIAMGRNAAMRECVDLWYTDNGTTFVRVVRGRAASA
jgi:hypothetical protein